MDHLSNINISNNNNNNNSLLLGDNNIDNEDKAYLKKVCSSFLNYHVDSLRDISKQERDYELLTDYYKNKLIFNYNEKIERYKTLVNNNYSFLLKIACDYHHLFKFQSVNNNVYIEPLIVENKDILKLRSTLKLFVRDWSLEGKKERENCHDKILKELNTYKNPRKNKHNYNYKVLVPGAGLGRLVFDLCRLGFIAEGNEFSYHMLLCSNFILNKTSCKDEFTIYPFVHNFCNNLNKNSSFKEIKIPDIDIQKELNKEVIINEYYKCNNISCECSSNKETICKNSIVDGDMSMVAGEFILVYNNSKYFNSFDSVLTCYFIDTAHNIIEYIDCIYNVLKINGIWINFGPLLYHYSAMENELSIELSWEEIKIIITEKYNFEIIKEELVDSEYNSNSESMMKTIFKCIFFTARKTK